MEFSFSLYVRLITMQEQETGIKENRPNQELGGQIKETP
jgi:hypothetical protein